MPLLVSCRETAKQQATFFKQGFRRWCGNSHDAHALFLRGALGDVNNIAERTGAIQRLAPEKRENPY